MNIREFGEKQHLYRLYILHMKTRNTISTNLRLCSDNLIESVLRNVFPLFVITALTLLSERKPSNYTVGQRSNPEDGSN